MQILGILGLYFDAVVVQVEKILLFSDWLWPYCVAFASLLHFTINLFSVFVYKAFKTNTRFTLF
jgi:hypothetical protein